MAVSPAPPRHPFPPGKSPFRVKGVTYRNLVDMIEETVPGGRPALLAKLDRELREFASQSFLPSTFYDSLPSVPLCETAAALTNRPFAQFVRELSRYSAERDAKGIYRMLLRLISPHTIMERLPATARQYFDFVTSSVEKIGPTAYRTTARGVPQFLSQFYMLVTEAFLSHALTLAGARGLAHQWLPATPDGTNVGIAIVCLKREVSWQ
jgi:hypothetical protein